MKCIDNLKMPKKSTINFNNNQQLEITHIMAHQATDVAPSCSKNPLRPSNNPGWKCATQKIPLWSREKPKTDLIQRVVVLIEDYYAARWSLDASPDPSHAVRSFLLISVIPFISSLVTNLRRFLGRLMSEMFSSPLNEGSGEGERGRWPTTGVNFLSTSLSQMWSVWSFWQAGINMYQAWCN